MKVSVYLRGASIKTPAGCWRLSNTSYITVLCPKS
jgi:hypothetical protein